MKLPSRRVIRGAVATAAALAITVAVAAPSLATPETDVAIVDPSAAVGTIPSWAEFAPAAVDAAATDPALTAALAQQVIAEARTGGSAAFAADSLPASAALVRSHFADLVPAGSTVLAAAGSTDRALVAYSAGTASVVYANPTTSPASVDIDLRSFAEPAGAVTTVHAADAAGALVAAAPVAVGAAGVVSLSVPAHGVITAVTTGLTERASAAPAARVAEAAASDLVGEPQLTLIESVHAPGKVIELGNEAAQQTGPAGATWTAEAAVFTLATTPGPLQAQAVTFYPVTGAANTFVIVAPDGRVLARRTNGDPNERYLALRDVTIDQAAVDPYAQWTVVAGANGVSYFHNVQRDSGGRVAGLDLYNWKTADGSEVQTYDAGTAAVQQWRVHPLTAAVPPVTGVTERGLAPSLPRTLTATYPWGRRATLSPIVWEVPAASAWDAEGTVTVPGSAAGYFGETVAVEAVYTVGSLQSEVAAALSAPAGVTIKELQMRAPRTVSRAVSGSDQSVTAPVTWDWARVSDADFAAAGTVIVPGIAGLGFSATLTITVQPATTVNLLRQGGVHYDYTHMNGGSFGLIDGNRNVQGFDDWRAGGAVNRVNPNTVSFFFDEPRQVTGASVFDIGGRDNVGGVTVQYRTLTGGWVDLPAGSQAWPYVNTTPQLRLEVTGEAVVATGVRVIITHKSDATWMSLSEVEVYGPAVAR
ncbi:Ig-like domain-containing protein [Microbacterium sp. NPDC089189]|uniref:Ig-like domain-containing protein n=1 Tax=Microbacterium sp. NPDC089189 TaxID=3154972 RepID=UPI00342CCCB0